ncbi:COP9 signalosome complex subunit 3 [Gracilariopsis chorda]|uniref:COP9 signalosome complex subunit 3 n=1 Tax=Gracilariopsis chorda TaxID=448386 RepID=A0A2V3IX13_9FLOR|nr:COP9 signalosome complex subunit 3 [Gracilariopsis chorda]|eukprot:PXF46688.1 COP9 signalosome complex subunit 3 [Gracilariopsis chorda]
MEPDTAHAANQIHPNRISSFPEALQALKAYALPPSLSADSLRASHDLLARTLDAVNTADVTTLHAQRSHLHPAQNLLAYISTLHASLSAVHSASPLVPQLLNEFVALVRNTPATAVPHALIRWIGVCRHAARVVIDTSDVHRALALIRPLRLAADKLATSPQSIVPIHADFLAVCLQAKCYKYAARWLRQRKRLHIDPATGLQASDVHLVYHYAAMVYMGLKDFSAALHCCRLALAVPAPTQTPLLQVAVCTFKYYILLHLLVTGKAPQPFKFSSYQFSRLRSFSSEYTELATAYERMDRCQTVQLFESNRDTFEKHGNLGLVKQVMRTLTDALIERLTNSFVTMNIANVASRVGQSNEEHVHQVLLRMIEQGKINARIDDRKRVVRLIDAQRDVDERLFAQVSGALMQQSLQVLQRIDEFREKLQTDPAYVGKTMGGRAPRRGASSHAFGSSAGGASASKRQDGEMMRVIGGG